MIKTHINPHQLVDRLERNYQKKTRFQKYKTITNYFRHTMFQVRDMPMRHPLNESPNMLDYEYTNPS